MREEQALERDDGIPWLPPGVRFRPKDEELLTYYLMPKLMGQRLPWGTIREAEVYNHHPQELLGNDDVAYFFTSRNRKYPKGRRPDRKASGGHWKASSGDKDIMEGPVFGRKRSLNYFIDDGTPKGRKTKWLMVEYTIPCSQLPLQDEKLDAWVICKIYVHNREEDPHGSEAVPEDQEIGSSSSHSVVHENAKGPTEINNLQQDMITGRQVQMLPNHSNHSNELVHWPYHPPYANRGMVMPNYMPLRAVPRTAQYVPSRLGQRPSDSQPAVILPLLPSSSFKGYAEAEPSTSYASTTMSMSTPPPDFSTTWPWRFDSELRDITKVLEDNYVLPQSVLQTKHCDPSMLDQGPSDSQHPVILPSLPPFKGCAKARPSTSYVSATSMHMSTPPSDFFAILPSFSDLEWQEILEVLDGHHARSQSIAQITPYDPSRLSQEVLDSQPPLALPPPPSDFTEYAAIGPSTSYASNAVPTSNPPPDFSATSSGHCDSGLPNVSEDLEGNNVPLQSVARIAQHGPSRLIQGISNSWPLVALPPLPSPFTECAEAGASTSHTNALVSISTPPLDFSATVLELSDSELSDLSTFIEDLKLILASTVFLLD